MEEHDIRQQLDEHRYDQAFELILARNKEKVFRLAVSMMRNETQAEDVTQEVFVRIWKALPRYSGAASLSTWIYSITRNACLTELKKRSNHPVISLNSPELEHIDPPGPSDDSSGAQQDVLTLLQRLPDHYQQVIRLFYLEQKSYDEVAAMLDMPLGTVKTLLFRGRKELLRLGAAATRLEQQKTTFS